MHETLAQALAERGNRVVTLDLLGHGDSDRPRDKWRYSMPAFGAQVIALLDHLGEDEAVVMGTSLGANVGARGRRRSAPERLRGMVIEMPVLDHALLGCAIAFTPLMVALTAGEPAMRAARAVTRLVPRRRCRGRPTSCSTGSARTRSRAPPCSRACSSAASRRRARSGGRCEAPALVIGHQYDLIHPFSDAGMLADELPNGRLLEASSLLELRFAPRRLTDEIAALRSTSAGARGGARTRAERAETRPKRPAATLTAGCRVAKRKRNAASASARSASSRRSAPAPRRKRMQIVFGGVLGVVAVDRRSSRSLVARARRRRTTARPAEVPAGTAADPGPAGVRPQEGRRGRAAARSANPAERGLGPRGEELQALRLQAEPADLGQPLPEWYQDGIYAPGDTPEPRQARAHARARPDRHPVQAGHARRRPSRSSRRSTTRTTTATTCCSSRTTTEMPSAVAATAWDHQLDCPTMNDKVFDAIRAFRTELHRQGPRESFP